MLVVTAAAVLFGPARWTRWPAFLVPLTLGIGAPVAAFMSSVFFEQLSNLDNSRLLSGA